MAHKVSDVLAMAREAPPARATTGDGSKDEARIGTFAREYAACRKAVAWRLAGPSRRAHHFATHRRRRHRTGIQPCPAHNRHSLAVAGAGADLRRCRHRAGAGATAGLAAGPGRRSEPRASAPRFDPGRRRAGGDVADDGWLLRWLAPEFQGAERHITRSEQ